MTFTTRGIALAVHCLRQSRFVREIEAAGAWLESPDVEAELLRRLPGFERYLLPWLQLLPVRTTFLAALDWSIPGTSRHLLVRKLWFHDQARSFLDSDEPRQVVILGAGLDGLGIRLAKHHPLATIIECDRAAPMQLKQRWLDAAGWPALEPQSATGPPGRSGLPSPSGPARIGGGPRFLARDLATETGLEALATDRPTLILAEGLLMYLTAGRISELLAGCVQHLRGEVRLAFSYLDADILRDPASPTARLGRALARRGEPEPFRWAMEPGTEPVFLNESGFTIDATFDCLELARRTLGRAACSRSYGESLATARRS